MKYLIHIRHPKEDPSEDDGVEDAHQGDAEHDPQGDEGDLPGPGDDAERESDQDYDRCVGDLLVEFESEKHKLEYVDSTEQLELKCPVMSDTPHTDGDTEDTNHHQGDEHQDPLKHDWSIERTMVFEWSPCVSWCPGYPR